MFGRLFQSRSARRLVDRLHGDIVAAARQPALYVDCGVPDTLDGRFEMLVVHCSAVLRRLEAAPAPGSALAQDLTDSMFRHLDIALRETGVTDLGVPKRMKKLASAFFGRALAYADALAQDTDEPLAAAFARNIFGGSLAADDRRVARLARYARAVDKALSTTPNASLLAGMIAFPAAGEPERDAQ